MPNWKKLIVSGSDAVLNTVTASGFLGNLTGTASWATNASSASVTQDNSTNTSRFVVFSDSNTTGPQVLRNDSGLTYNPSTNALTASVFVGALSGNATTSTTATNANNLLIVDADSLLWGGGAVPLLFPANSAAASPGTNQAVYGDTELTYDPSSNTLTLAAASSASFGANSRILLASGSELTLARQSILRAGETGVARGATVNITGSTYLYNSGSTILTAAGIAGNVLTVEDTVTSVIFDIVSGSNTLLSVTTAGVALSGSISLYGLTTTNQSNVLTIDTATGLVYYTASTAFGGGGGGAVSTYTNGVDNRVVTSTGATGINGEANFTFDGTTLILTGSAIISGSGLTITGSVTATSFTGSLLGTSSWANSASVVSMLRAGSSSAASFGGSPRTGSVVFGTAYSNNNYSVTVTGEDARSWTIQSKSSTGFTINTNSSTTLTGPVYWIATSWQ